MSKNIGLDQALAFVNCQLRQPGGPFKQPANPAVTISRMTGSGGRTVAAKLAEYLEKHSSSHCPWTVFDRNLVEKVLEEHDLPKRIAEYMPESHKSLLPDTVEELLGLHPSSWTLIQKTTETVWHLAQMGHVILVGRAANIITNKLASVVHVRLVGTVERRALRVQEAFSLGATAALELIKREDHGRKHYVREHFGKDIDDPLLYHVIINSDQIGVDDAAALIGEVVMKRFQLGGRH